ncbi:MAG: N-acetyl sugar amidotransferase [Bacteroidia bacterium]
MGDFQQCFRCVLDTTAPLISFDEKGVCNYCHNYDSIAAKTILRPPEVRKNELNVSLAEIKKRGKGKPYDCILGISGGVDSTYLAWLAKEFGLRPLLVHFDNGWNSELAVKNIENIVNVLGFDLHTHVINWEEFKDLQLAYLYASVVDTEVPTDQLIFASLHKIAWQKGIKSILNGNNVATEGIMPEGWNFSQKTDLVNLTTIHKKFGKRKLRNFPKLSLYHKYFYTNLSGIKSYKFLDLVDYNKDNAKKIIKDKLGWKDYGYKHYESVFTRFYQGYILPVKFNIDKRKAHLSSLICSGQITRQQALDELKQPPYPIEQQNEDRAFVIKKFELTEEEFDTIMKLPQVPHEHYGSQWDKKKFRYYYWFTKLANPFAALLKRING